MEDGEASFAARADALMRKSLVFQKRSWRTNACLVTFPAFLCLLLFGIQLIVDTLMSLPEFSCGCECIPVFNSTDCEKKCGLQYSDIIQAPTCPVPSPYQLPAFLQVPRRRFQAVNYEGEFPGFPDPSCRPSQSCPVSFLYTGLNRTVADGLMSTLLSGSLSSDPFSSLVPGAFRRPPIAYFIEPGLPNGFYFVQSDCANLSGFFPCFPSLMLWRDSRSSISSELYRGYRKANRNKWINEVALAYDFLNTSVKKLEVTIFYNATYAGDIRMDIDPGVVRVSRSMNLITQSFLRMITLNQHAELPISFVKEMPKLRTKYTLDFSSLLGPLFYMWVLQLLLPVMLTSLVYEKEKNLRLMMKMHGLGDGPYWLVTYGYFLVLSVFYVFCFVIFGSLVGLDFFRENSYTIQLVFLTVFVNLQISLSFFGAALFSSMVTATVCGYLYVFAFGLLGSFLFHDLVEDFHATEASIFALQLLPGFSLYRGLYEFAQYAIAAGKKGTQGMTWKNLRDKENAMVQVLCIMAVEWIFFILLGAYLDQVLACGNGLRKHPLFFIQRWLPMRESSSCRQVQPSEDPPNEEPDVLQERTFVEELRTTGRVQDCSLVADDLMKVYLGEDENPDKFAVRGLSLAVKRGECFGMLGPNGAGKTTCINMMIGFLMPSAGKTFIEGLDISCSMDKLYSVMGVCPQHDLLWEALTGKEHLLFYGRLKNLKGNELEKAVETTLKNVNLFNGGVGDKRAGTYSGGMKRRLSVAISLIGNPKVVFMDEPSTGLDPASRKTLWRVIRQAKQDRAIILTTHSMEEAEALCDRVGIFVEGKLRCIGSSKALKARYGGAFKFTITTALSKIHEVVSMVSSWSTRATRVYNLSGTQKFELPRDEVDIARVFSDVQVAKEDLGIQAWGLADTTLEDVFMQVVTC